MATLDDLQLYLLSSMRAHGLGARAIASLGGRSDPVLAKKRLETAGLFDVVVPAGRFEKEFGPPALILPDPTGEFATLRRYHLEAWPDFDLALQVNASGNLTTWCFLRRAGIPRLEPWCCVDDELPRLCRPVDVLLDWYPQKDVLAMVGPSTNTSELFLALDYGLLQEVSRS